MEAITKALPGLERAFADLGLRGNDFERNPNGLLAEAGFEPASTQDIRARDAHQHIALRNKGPCRTGRNPTW